MMRSFLGFLCSKAHRTQAKFRPQLKPDCPTGFRWGYSPGQN